MNFDKTLATIAKTTDVKKLLEIIANAKKLYGETHIVVREARDRLAIIQGPLGALGNDYKAMRQATIEVTGNDGRLATLRANRGVIGALEYLMQQPTSGAFAKLVAAERGRETAEAFVLGHREHFSKSAVYTAKARLPGITRFTAI